MLNDSTRPTGRIAEGIALGHALSVIFRAKVRDALDKAKLLDRVPKNVLDYIARYLFRIAIANSRLEHFDGDHVTFRYRDNRSGVLQRCRLPAQEFIRRFLQHVLPRGLAKVRSYGLYSPTCRAALDHARSLLAQELANLTPDHHDHALRDESTDDTVSACRDHICPCCRRGVMKIVQTLAPRAGPSSTTRGPP
jgi:hypothetical protein